MLNNSFDPEMTDVMDATDDSMASCGTEQSSTIASMDDSAVFTVSTPFVTAPDLYTSDEDDFHIDSIFNEPDTSTLGLYDNVDSNQNAELDSIDKEGQSNLSLNHVTTPDNIERVVPPQIIDKIDSIPTSPSTKQVEQSEINFSILDEDEEQPVNNTVSTEQPSKLPEMDSVSASMDSLNVTKVTSIKSLSVDVPEVSCLEIPKPKRKPIQEVKTTKKETVKRAIVKDSKTGKPSDLEIPGSKRTLRSTANATMSETLTKKIPTSHKQQKDKEATTSNKITPTSQKQQKDKESTTSNKKITPTSQKQQKDKESTTSNKKITPTSQKQQKDKEATTSNKKPVKSLVHQINVKENVELRRSPRLQKLKMMKE